MAVKMMTLDEVVQSGEQRKVERELSFPVNLPSKGRHGYPEVIMCRPLKVKDVKALVKAVGSVEGELEYLDRLVRVIQDTVIEHQVNLADLSLQDFMKVLLVHRVNSLGEFLDVVFDCDGCGKGGQVMKVDLMKLEEKELNEEYGRDPIQVGKFKVRYPRLSVFLGRKGNLDEVTDFDLVEDMLRGSDVNVDDLEWKEFSELVEWLRKWYGSYGLQTVVKAKCKECGKEVEVGIPYLFFLFVR